MAIDRRTMVGCGEKAISANTNGDENRSFAKQLSEWLSIRTQRVHASLDECREPFKGTVRTPSIASGRGYCLQTAHLESRRLDHFARKPANPPSYVVRKGCNLICYNHTVRWRSPRTMIVQSHWCMRGGSSRKLKSRSRLVEPFYDGNVCPELYGQSPSAT